MKITNVKKAVGEYNRINQGHANYGYLMLDRESGKVWVDEFCDWSRSSYVQYDCPAVINLVRWAAERWPNEVIRVTMQNVKLWAATACTEWS